jgi:hypothetical protein
MLRVPALLILTLPALMAHEGHHQAESVLWHVLTEPDHLAMLAAALVLVIGSAWLLLRRRRPQPVRDVV